MSTNQVLALVVIVALIFLAAGYWLAQLEQTREMLMSYRDLHGHVHARLGLKPPKKET